MFEWNIPCMVLYKCLCFLNVDDKSKMATISRKSFKNINGENIFFKISWETSNLIYPKFYINAGKSCRLLWISKDLYKYYVCTGGEGDGDSLQETSILSNVTDEGLDLSQRISESIFQGPELDMDGEEILRGKRNKSISPVFIRPHYFEWKYFSTLIDDNCGNCFKIFIILDDICVKICSWNLWFNARKGKKKRNFDFFLTKEIGMLYMLELSPF